MGVVKFLNRIDNDVYVGVLLDRPLGTCDGTLNVCMTNHLYHRTNEF